MWLLFLGWDRALTRTKHFSQMLTKVTTNATIHVKLAIYYELEGTGDPSITAIENDLTYIYNTRLRQAGVRLHSVAKISEIAEKLLELDTITKSEYDEMARKETPEQ